MYANIIFAISKIRYYRFISRVTKESAKNNNYLRQPIGITTNISCKERKTIHKVPYLISDNH